MKFLCFTQSRTESERFEKFVATPKDQFVHCHFLSNFFESLTKESFDFIIVDLAIMPDHVDFLSYVSKLLQCNSLVDINARYKDCALPSKKSTKNDCPWQSAIFLPYHSMQKLKHPKTMIKYWSNANGVLQRGHLVTEEKRMVVRKLATLFFDKSKIESFAIGKKEKKLLMLFFDNIYHNVTMYKMGEVLYGTYNLELKNRISILLHHLREKCREDETCPYQIVRVSSAVYKLTNKD